MMNKEDWQQLDENLRSQFYCVPVIFQLAEETSIGAMDLMQIMRESADEDAFVARLDKEFATIQAQLNFEQEKLARKTYKEHVESNKPS